MVRDCPVPAPAETGGAPGITTTSTARVRTPLAAWKYVKPDDVTVPRVDAQGKIWKFCSKCKCRATNTMGYYQLSHYEADHIDNFRRSTNNVTPPATTTSSSTTNTTAPPEVPTAPQSNLSSVTNPNPIPPGPPDITSREPTESQDLDEMQFTGMWCASVPDTEFTADATATMSTFNLPFCFGMWTATVYDIDTDSEVSVSQFHPFNIDSLTLRPGSLVEREPTTTVVLDMSEILDPNIIEREQGHSVATASIVERENVSIHDGEMRDDDDNSVATGDSKTYSDDDDGLSDFTNSL